MFCQIKAWKLRVWSSIPHKGQVTGCRKECGDSQEQRWQELFVNRTLCGYPTRNGRSVSLPTS
jgi:hypothetical protein